MISTTLVNRTIVLTGAAGGIGAACAHAFSELGAGITLLDSSADGLARLSAELSRPPASAAVCDLTDPRAVANAFDEVGARFGRIDALVNLVGVSGRGRIEDVSDVTWNQVISVNLTSVFYTCRAALPWIRAAAAPFRFMRPMTAATGSRWTSTRRRAPKRAACRKTASK